MTSHHCYLKKVSGQKRDTAHGRAPRRGVVLIMVIVTVSVSMVLFGIWAKNMVNEHRRLANQQYRMQATRLAEAGVQRAIARRTADPAFTEESWSVPRESFGGAHGGTVQIRVVAKDDATLRYEATAQFPAGAARRAQVTRQIEASITSGDNES
jgi:type II secretory pathway component PulK